MAQSTPADAVKQDAPGAPTWLALTLVALSLVVAAAAVVAVARRSGDGAAPADAVPAAVDALPSSLAGLPTTVHLSGPEAVDAVTGLHIGDVNVHAAEVADYGGGQIVVWVSWSVNEDAVTQVEQMTDKIAQGGTPFAIPEAVETRPGTYATRGNGQVHYYWARDGGVWWLAADRALAEQALDELVGGAG